MSLQRVDEPVSLSDGTDGALNLESTVVAIIIDFDQQAASVVLDVGWDALRNRLEDVIGIETGEGVVDARPSAEQLARMQSAMGLLHEKVLADFCERGREPFVLCARDSVAGDERNGERKNDCRETNRDEAQVLPDLARSCRRCKLTLPKIELLPA